MCQVEAHGKEVGCVASDHRGAAFATGGADQAVRVRAAPCLGMECRVSVARRCSVDCVVYKYTATLVTPAGSDTAALCRA